MLICYKVFVRMWVVAICLGLAIEDWHPGKLLVWMGYVANGSTA